MDIRCEDGRILDIREGKVLTCSIPSKHRLVETSFCVPLLGTTGMAVAPL